jgi:hypothetical protein
VLIDQTQSGDAIANAPQTSTIDQGDDSIPRRPPGGAGTDGRAGRRGRPHAGGNLLDVNLDVDADVDAARPSPVPSPQRQRRRARSTRPWRRTSAPSTPRRRPCRSRRPIINQDLDGVTAEATADQDSTIQQ